MGIFDFLGDLSSQRSKELGLGGLQSLLGTRGAAQAGAIGDEMIGITNKDSLPGYFNEQTREYVPWYVDLFDGGGLNAAGGQAQKEAARSGAAGVTPGGAPMAQPGLLRPRARRDPLEQFGGAGPTIPEGPLGPFGGAGPRISAGDPRQMGGASGYGQTGVSPLDPFGGAGPAIPAPAQQGVLPQMQDNVPMSTLAPFTAEYESTPRLSEMQTSIMQHPEFPQFVDIMKRAGNESAIQDPAQAQMIFNNYLKQIGYN